MRLVYISEYPSSVFHSQVKSLLNYFILKDELTEIYLILSCKSKVDFEEIYKSGLNYNIKIYNIKAYPNLSFFQIFRSRSLRKCLDRVKLNPSTIIHTRSDNYSIALNRMDLKGSKIVTDFRGLSIEESELYSKRPILNYFKKRYFQRSFHKAINISSHIFVVSQSFKDYVIKNSSKKHIDISVNSCLAPSIFKYDNVTRDMYRNKIGAKHETIVVVFLAGGNSGWQQTSTIIESLKKHNVLILNMSKQEFEFENVINIFCNYEEVPNYLSAADIGVIFRENNVVNKVASPVKFSEYVCSGLPVISNNSVDLIVQCICEYKIGIIVNDLSVFSEDDIKSLLTLDRNLISKVGISLFGIEFIANRYLQVYKKLITDDHSC